MPHRSPLPTGYDVPERVGRWTYDSDSGKNAHAWYGPDRETAVGVFANPATIDAYVFEERCYGLDRKQQVAGCPQPDADDDVAAAVREVIEDAVAWMQSTTPAEWEHPDVNRHVFDAPAGYELAFYELSSRQHLVYYHYEDAPEYSSLYRENKAAGKETPVTPETYPYFVIECWRGSGNATLSLAPWKRAHDSERVEVRDLPDECGLDIALKYAREYAREEVIEDDADAEPVGQTGLDTFAEGSL